MIGALLLALKNLTRSGARYRVILSSVAYSALVIIAIPCVFAAMSDNLERKARVYYGGDVTVTGILDAWRFTVRDAPAIEAALRSALPPGTTITRRYEHRDSATAVFFGGESVRQRIIVGLDFSAEREAMGTLTITQGNADLAGLRGAILMSEQSARKLGARVGDEVTLVTTTEEGFKNSAQAVIGGIFKDPSLFGQFTTYMDIETLRAAVGAGPEGCTLVCAYLPEGRKLDRRLTAAVQASLEGAVPTVPLLRRRQDFYEWAVAEQFRGMRYALLSLRSNLDQVGKILEAIYALAAGLTAILTGLVGLGLAGALKVVVHERSRDIGALRAMGMGRAAAAGSILAEAAGIAMAGSALGAVLAALALRLIGGLDLSAIPLFDIFLAEGRLRSAIRWDFAATAAAGLTVAAVAAAAGPAVGAARVDPAISLRRDS